MTKVHSNLTVPAVEMLTGDEVKDALVRYVVNRKGVPVTSELLAQIDSEVSYRNVRLPDGTVTMFASVGLFEKPKSPTDTPHPKTESKDG